MAAGDISQDTKRTLEENNVPMDDLTKSEIEQLDSQINGENISE